MTGIMRRLVRNQPPEVGNIAGVKALFHKAVRISSCFEFAEKGLPRQTVFSWSVNLHFTPNVRPKLATKSGEPFFVMEL
jgi:hypothetical protein